MRTSRGLDSLFLFFLLGTLAGSGSAQEGSGTAQDAISTDSEFASDLSQSDPEAEPQAPLKQSEPVEEGLTIGTIVFDSVNVFDTADPEQDRLLYRLANRLHRVSTEESLKNQLLFRPGDLFSVDKMEESERALRARAGLYDADIEVVGVHDGVADLAVHTRDVWTLSGGLRFGRSGGENRSSFTLKDSNLLGMGKQLRLKQSSSVDRTGTEFGYSDPNLAGSRNQLALAFASNSDGDQWSLNAGRPFYELDSHWAASVIAESGDRIDRRFLRGEATDLFSHHSVRYELGGGWSRGLRDGKSQRLLFGMTYQEDRFSSVVALQDDDPLPSGTLPEDRIMAYPWVGYEFLRDSFIEETNLDLIDRTEDRYRGFRASARLGFSSAALGGDGSKWIFEGVLSDSWKFGDRQLIELSASSSGRYGGDGFENTFADVNGRYYLRQGGHWVLFARLGAEAAVALDYDQQLLLGGENGLRGFPLRYQDGNRRVLFTLEERLFTDWKPFRLFNVGAAAFLDVGRAWFAGSGSAVTGFDGTDFLDNSDLDYGGVLANLGVGLRLGNTRAHGTIVHIDLAFPVGGDPSLQSVQWLVSSRQSF